MFAFLSGAKAYAYLAIGIVVLALSGAVAFLWQMHKLDVAKARQLQTSNEQLEQTIKQEEADKAELSRRIGALDEALKHEQELQSKLAQEKQAISEKLDALKKTLPAEDQACLSRPLPSGILDLLRDGPGNNLQDRNSEDTGKPADALYEESVSG